MSDVLSRLRIYQAERFPVLRTSALVSVFSAASVSASAHLAGRDVPGPMVYLAAFVVTLCFFFQLRVLDEIKDAEDDRLYRPERPIPRGLVTLRLIVGLGVATVPVSILACAAVDVRLLGPLLLVWVWMGLMTAEFFVPTWLKARPAAYTISHMLVMPLIDLVLTGFEWLPAGSAPHALTLFLLMSFANGCILEIGRKLWSPSSERHGVETYSALMGPRRAGTLWISCMLASLVLLFGVGLATGAPVVTGLVGIAAAVFTGGKALAYRRDPSVAAQASMDSAAGTWVFACYVAAGFAPLIGF